MYPTTYHSPNIQQALINNETTLLQHIQQLAVSKSKLHLFLRIFKAEQNLEVWLKNREDQQWQYFKTYTFCQSSGTMGPKRKEGDRQIPEGIYHIDRFNPKSKYHLSLGLNYPNAADRILGDPQAPGSDIYIHGGCETVGCIPITDAGIEEVYLLATWARENGQIEIPVYLFPFQFIAENRQKYLRNYPQYLDLWQQLEAINAAFEEKSALPRVAIQQNGEYRIIDGPKKSNRTIR